MEERFDGVTSLDDLVQAEETRYSVQNPAFTGLLSALVMGLGQFYNGQVRAAKVFFATQLCLLLYLYDFLSAGEVSVTVIGWTSPLVYGFFMALLVGTGGIVWAYNVYDAYSTAKFCEMIYDRTLPSLDDEEEELVAAHLQTATFGVEHHRGAWRQVVFVGLAIFLYSIALFSLGSYFSGSSGDLARLEARLQDNPGDVFSHLQLGDLLMADGDYLGAAREFDFVVEHSDDVRWTAAAYSNLSSLYRRVGDEEKAQSMLRRAIDAGLQSNSAGTPASVTPTPSPVPTTVAVRPDPNKAKMTELELDFALEQAKTELELGNFAGVISSLDQLEARGLRNATSLALKAKAHTARGDLARARACVDAALTENPKEALALGARLEIALAGSEKGEMLAAYKSLVEVSHDDVELIGRTADRLVELSFVDEAYAVVSEELSAHPTSPALLKRAFDISRRRGNEEQAFQAGLALIDAEVRDAEVYAFLATKCAERNQTDAALKYLRALTVVEPGKSQWQLEQGDLLAKTRDFPAALEAYRRALVIDEANPDIYVKLASLAQETRAFSDALLYLERAVEYRPLDVALLKKLGNLQQDAGRTDAALSTLDRALRIDPDDLGLKYRVGVLHLDADEAVEALPVLKSVFSVSPTFKDVAYHLGRCEERLGNTGRARSAYLRVSSRSQFSQIARERLLVLDETTAGPEGVIAAVELEANESGSRLPVLSAAGQTGVVVPVERYADHLKTAELAFREGRLEVALESYEQVLKVYPTHYRSLFQKGVILRELGRKEAALLSLRAARQSQPEELGALIELGNIYTDLERYDDAIEQFEGAVRSDPKHLAARYTLGWLFEKRKNYAKAEEHYKAIAWFYPEYIKAYDYLGNIFFVQAKYDEALRNFEKILAVDDDDAAVRFKIALTLMNLKKGARARRELVFLKTQLASDHPLYPQVTHMLAKLQ